MKSIAFKSVYLVGQSNKGHGTCEGNVTSYSESVGGGAHSGTFNSSKRSGDRLKVIFEVWGNTPFGLKVVG